MQKKDLKKIKNDILKKNKLAIKLKENILKRKQSNNSPKD